MYVQPIDLTYYTTDIPSFNTYNRQLKEQIKEEEYPKIWLYQQGRFFVTSDNYPAYHAYLESECPFVVGIVLGKPDHPAVSQVSGPFKFEQKA